MTIYFASDHAGMSLRQILLSYVKVAGHDVIDLGPEETTSVDYPDFGVKLAMALSRTMRGAVSPFVGVALVFLLRSIGFHGCAPHLWVSQKWLSWHASIMTPMFWLLASG